MNSIHHHVPVLIVPLFAWASGPASEWRTTPYAARVLLRRIPGLTSARAVLIAGLAGLNAEGR